MPSNDKISLMSAATTGDILGSAARIEVSKAYATSPVTLGLDLATLRTSMFAGSTGYTATDPLVVGAISASGNFAIATNKFTVASASGNTAVAGTLAVTGTSTLTGNVGIGGAADTTTGLYLRSAALTGTTQVGAVIAPVATSAATSAVYGSQTYVNTAAGAYTTVTGYAVAVSSPTIASTAITTMYGLYVFNQGQAKSTNAYGVYIAAQSGAATTNIGLYNGGTTTLVGVLTSTVVSGDFITNISGTTGVLTIKVQNTSNASYFGLEGSAAGARFTGTEAYATLVGTVSAKSLQFATNNAVALTIASTGAATFSSTITVNATGSVFSAGTDASTTVTIGGGGTAPAAIRLAALTLDAPSSGSFVGSAALNLKRSTTTLWQIGIDDGGVVGAKTSNTDLYFFGGGNYRAALSTAGALTLAAGLTVAATIASDTTAASGTLAATGMRLHANATYGAILRGYGSNSDVSLLHSGNGLILTNTPGSANAQFAGTLRTTALGINGAPTATSKLNITGLPTSAAGLAAGDVWSNSGVLTIV